MVAATPATHCDCTRPPCCSTGTSIANAINLGSALKVSQTGDSSNYPDTALSGCADPTDFNNGTKGDGGDVVSAAPCRALRHSIRLFG